MGQRGLAGVLGEHGDASLRAEVEGVEGVGDAVERVADLGPAEGTGRVGEGRLVRPVGGELAGEGGHQPATALRKSPVRSGAPTYSGRSSRREKRHPSGVRTYPSS